MKTTAKFNKVQGKFKPFTLLLLVVTLIFSGALTAFGSDMFKASSSNDTKPIVPGEFFYLGGHQFYAFERTDEGTIRAASKNGVSKTAIGLSNTAPTNVVLPHITNPNFDLIDYYTTDQSDLDKLVYGDHVIQNITNSSLYTNPTAYTDSEYTYTGYGELLKPQDIIENFIYLPFRTQSTYLSSLFTYANGEERFLRSTRNSTPSTIETTPTSAENHIFITVVEVKPEFTFINKDRDLVEGVYTPDFTIDSEPLAVGDTFFIGVNEFIVYNTNKLLGAEAISVNVLLDQGIITPSDARGYYGSSLTGTQRIQDVAGSQDFLSKIDRVKVYRGNDEQDRLANPAFSFTTFGFLSRQEYLQYQDIIPTVNHNYFLRSEHSFNRIVQSVNADTGGIVSGNAYLRPIVTIKPEYSFVDNMGNLMYQDVGSTLFSQGDGSEENPYVISDSDEFEYFVWLASNNTFTEEEKGHFILSNDIDISDYGLPFIDVHARYIVLDGKGHSISNLSITDRLGNKQFGLFSTLANSSIKNIIIKDSEITANNGTSCCIQGYAGLFAGETNNVTFNNIILENNMLRSNVTSYNTNNSGIGGLVGRSVNTSYSKIGIIDAYGLAQANVGVIAGHVSGATVLEEIAFVNSDPLASGKFTINSSNSERFGVVGRTLSGHTIKNAYSNISLATPTTLGTNMRVSIFGTNLVQTSFFEGNLANTHQNVQPLVNYGGSVNRSYYWANSVSNSTHPIGASLTTAEIRQQDSFVGFDFENVWQIDEGVGSPKLQWFEYYLETGLVNSELATEQGNEEDSTEDGEGNTGDEEGNEEDGSTPTEPSEIVTWSFNNPDAPFLGVKPSITVYGGKAVNNVTLHDVEWDYDGTFDTGYGAMTLVSDGNGNTIVSFPNGLGVSTTDETVELTHLGTNFMKVQIKPMPVLNFSF